MTAQSSSVARQDGPGRITRPVTSQAARSGYLPSLDGWRAIATVAVVMAHDEPWYVFGHSNAFWHMYGGWSVWLFFAISGFLVCTRILEDESARGRFDVRGFYIRRLCRIQPAMLFYLAVIALLTLFGVAHERWGEQLSALLLYKNYGYHHLDTSGRWYMTGHFWTLAVEEHFYLLLSLLLLLIRPKPSISRELVFAAIVALICWWNIWSPSRVSIYDPSDITRYTEFNLQYLLCPALLALLLRRPAVRAACIRFLHPWVAIGGTLVVMELSHPAPTKPLRHYLLFLILSNRVILWWSFQLWVVSTVLHPRSWTTRLLELPVFRYVGRLSYSLYLWHVALLVALAPGTGITAAWFLHLSERPWRYVAIASLSLISYYCIEKPFIRLGHRLAQPATPGHRDLDVQAAAAA